MFSKREDVVSAELTVLPDELLDEVAGGQPTFYEYTSPDGTETGICRPITAANNHSKLVPVYNASGAQVECPPKEEA